MVTYNGIARGLKKNYETRRSPRLTMMAASMAEVMTMFAMVGGLSNDEGDDFNHNIAKLFDYFRLSAAVGQAFIYVFYYPYSSCL